MLPVFGRLHRIAPMPALHNSGLLSQLLPCMPSIPVSRSGCAVRAQTYEAKHCSQVKISVTFRLLLTLTSCLPSVSSSLWDDQNSGRSSPISTNSPFWIFAACFAGTGGRPSPMYTLLRLGRALHLLKEGDLQVLLQWRPRLGLCSLLSCLRSDCWVLGVRLRLLWLSYHRHVGSL